MNARTPLSRAAAVMLAALAGPLLLAVPAAAAPATASYAGTHSGYANITIDETADSGSRDAGFFSFEIEGGDHVRALCIQYDVTLSTGADFETADRDGLPVDATAIGRATWIGVNHASVGTPLDDANMEAVAAAMAAWTFTDDKTWTQDNMEYPDARERAEELAAAAAAADPVPAGPTSFALEVTAERADEGNAVTADIVFATDDGTPLTGEDIVVTFSDGTSETVTTDSDGHAVTVADDIEESGVVSAAWSGTLPAGTVLDSQDGGQLVVTLDSARISRSAEANFNEAPAPVVEIEEPAEEPAEEPEEEPVEEEPVEEEPVAEVEEPAEEPVEEEPETVVESAPEPETTSARQELPYTGPGLVIPLLVGAGGAAAWWGRRMRRQATDELGG